MSQPNPATLEEAQAALARASAAGDLPGIMAAAQFVSHYATLRLQHQALFAEPAPAPAPQAPEPA